MRVVAEIPLADFKLTIYSWNNKYLLKYEKGMYEQTYKINELDVSGDVEIKQICQDPEFLKGVLSRFRDMNQHLNEAHNRVQ
jgi:hypothetical protein